MNYREEVINNRGRRFLGEEAEVVMQERNVFPGPGGRIITEVPADVVYKKNVRKGDPVLNTYLTHVVAKKLDDLAVRTGVYSRPHVTRPLGLIPEENAYLYEEAKGFSFPWVVKVPGDGDKEGFEYEVNLKEWGKAVSHFQNFGIGIAKYVSDRDNPKMSENVLHENPVIKANLELDQNWTRIDWGKGSVVVDYDRLGREVRDKKEYLVVNLSDNHEKGQRRYDMLSLTAEVLAGKGEMTKQLEDLLFDYRKASVRHLA